MFPISLRGSCCLPAQCCYGFYKKYITTVQAKIKQTSAGEQGKGIKNIATWDEYNLERRICKRKDPRTESLGFLYG